MVLDTAKLAVEFAPAAIAARDSALEKSALVARVSTQEEKEVAVEAQRSLQQIIAAAEKARKEAKAPILEYGRAIDGAAEKFVQEVKGEQIRVAQLVGNWEQEELAKQRAAEAARQLELQRIEQERQAELQRVENERRAQAAKLEEERRRLAAEAAQADAARRAEIAKLEAEAKRQLELSAAASVAESNRINEEFNRTNAAVPVVEIKRSEGQVVREDWDITITNEWQLARAHPTCVKLTPLLSEIRMLLDAGVKVAGVSAKRVVKSSVRVQTKNAITV
jgi:hypothetical protein